MSGILMMIIAIVVLGGAYLLYGRYLQNKWGIDPNAKTLVISLHQLQEQVRSTDRSRQQSSDGFRFSYGS